MLINIIDTTFPIYNKRYNPKFSSHWWDDNISHLITKRKQAFISYKTYSTLENFMTFKKIRAQCRKLIRIKKKESSQKYCEQLTNIDSKRVWAAIKKFSGNSTFDHKVPIPDKILLECIENLASNSASSRPIFRNSSEKIKYISLQEFDYSLKNKRSSAPV
ncbi:hypothetical protein WA026_008987 [Henosepilachna vigintioctopunctata]|uniref:Uncharacterized protein n=1 Tax=Henosepilachna vigintioctopunctata TaxID=420089 RepID=A0AAW1V3C7_9CUCU